MANSRQGTSIPSTTAPAISGDPQGYSTRVLSPALIRAPIPISSVNFGVKYLSFCEASPNLRLFLNSTLVDLGFDGKRVRTAEIRTNYQRGYSLEADTFILCLGGIENSRMLKFIDGRNGGVVPAGNLIGRYWMEHPHVQVGDAVFFGKGLDLIEDPSGAFALFLSDEVRLREGLLNAGFIIDPDVYREGWKTSVAEILCVAPALGRRLLAFADENLICGLRVRSEFEQQPNPENRVTLGQATDAFGIPRTELHWRRTEADRATIINNARTVAGELARIDLGRMKLDDWIMKGDRSELRRHRGVAPHGRNEDGNLRQQQRGRCQPQGTWA